jgi:4'-phosphopantetheinyl transferase
MRPADASWSAAPSGLKLADDNVHVFAAPLDVPAKRLEELEQWLSDDERQRASRFHLERDRRRFIAGRGILREILGTMSGVSPASLIFAYGEFGKPHIAAPVAARLLQFNLAHSDSIAVYATAKRTLGVDLERIRELDEVEQFAARFFSPDEEQRLLTLPDAQRREAFFNCWTRKEAYLKAIGTGLNNCIRQVEVSPGPGETAERLGVPDGSPRWRLHSLTPAIGFVGALVVQPEDSPVNCWHWNGPP